MQNVETTWFTWRPRVLASSEIARRNARAAAVECARRRLERENVEQFLAARRSEPPETQEPGRRSEDA